jgi:hypothetical protein
MKEKKGRIGLLRVVSYQQATVKEGRYVDPILVNSTWSSGDIITRDLYMVELNDCDIPLWYEANGNYVRFKINSRHQAVLYYNSKKKK